MGITKRREETEDFGSFFPPLIQARWRRICAPRHRAGALNCAREQLLKASECWSSRKSERERERGVRSVLASGGPVRRSLG